MDTLTVGIYNCGSPAMRQRANARPLSRAGVAAWLDKTGRHHNIDVFVLSEAEAYSRPLANLDGWRLIDADGWVDAGDSAFLVRDGVRVGSWRAIRMTRRWWGRRLAKWRAPRTMPTARVSWLRLLAVHMPPRPVDPRNAGAYAEQAGEIIRWARRRPRWRPRAAVGDFNAAVRDSKFINGPAYIAAQIDGTIHPQLQGIDLAITRNCRVIHVKKPSDNGGSDHPFIIVTVARG